MKKIISFALCIVILISCLSNVWAKESGEVENILSETSQYILTTVKNPQIASVGGEWSIIGLSRSGVDIPVSYFENYYAQTENHVKNRGGIIEDRKFTEYSRVIIALTAIGKDPQNVAGYNLIIPLADYEKVVWQGLNGAIWALLALDCGNFEIPLSPTAKAQATREMYIKFILDSQKDDGGFSLNPSSSADADTTAMAILALSRYRDVNDITIAIDKALLWLSQNQCEDGGFESFGVQTSESCAQVIVALCNLGIELNDERFTKNGNTVFDALLNMRSNDNGFAHIKGDSQSNLMATEQVLCALAALERYKTNQNRLYDMLDVIKSNTAHSGLPNKHQDINPPSVIYPSKTFDDIKNSPFSSAIESLASRGIINGKSDNMFDPEGNVTRAEFAAIISRGLGLNSTAENIFDDVRETDWFFDYVNTAYNYGIIKGISDTEFNPNGKITKQEAAIMVMRAAALGGLNTQIGDARDVLAAFTDYMDTANWAWDALAFCYFNSILPDDDLEIFALKEMSRDEIAQMLFNMFSQAHLLTEE